MNEFREWLENTKNYTKRSAGDVVSRLKRIQTLLNQNNIDNNTISNLECNTTFESFNRNIKSQLRIACRLYLEYNKKN